MDITQFSTFGSDEYSGAMEGSPWGGFSASQTRKKPFYRDTLYYHKELFDWREGFEKIHETEKAILFRVESGDFWVPKALLRTYSDCGYETKIKYRVHKSFFRKYISPNSPVLTPQSGRE